MDLYNDREQSARNAQRFWSAAGGLPGRNVRILTEHIDEVAFAVVLSFQIEFVERQQNLKRADKRRVMNGLEHLWRGFGTRKFRFYCCIESGTRGYA